MSKTQPLVSIIVPVYNAGPFLDATIKTVHEQTYSNWELIFINDCSQDISGEIIAKHQQKDTRITLINLTTNSGAAIARNTGIEKANGRYIAFLDADDLWVKDKLQKQVRFMQQKDCAFSFAGYEFADADGIPNGKKVSVPATITYAQALKNTTISTPTVMFDLEKLSKVDVFMPNVRRGQDTATWWKVLKKIDQAYGLNEVLFYYRRTNNSLSANKLKALQRTWNLYRNIEKLNISQSSYNFVWYCFNAAKRRV